MSMMQMLLGTSAGGSVSVADVYSTNTYTGNGTSQAITNGIDLSGQGGLVWIKDRNASVNNNLWDTERGVRKALHSNNSNAENTSAVGVQSLYAFNSNGFSLGSNWVGSNNSGHSYVAWTFRQAVGFFDIVTYTGNGSSGLAKNHNLGVVPEMIIVKKTSESSNANWRVFHSALGNTKAMKLDTDDTPNTDSGYWNNTSPTATQFTLGDNSNLNGNGQTHVAYLFASLDGISKIGSYNGGGTINNGPTITLGFEPQWIIIKATESGGQNWNIADSARGFTTSVGATNGKELRANSSDAEVTRRTLVTTSTGFQIMDSSNELNDSNKEYIYMAIAAP